MQEKPLALSARMAKVERELADMSVRLDTMQAGYEITRNAAKESRDLLKNLSDAFLKPQPGHDKSLLDRIAAVTIKIERGEWGIRLVAWAAGAVIAVAAAWTALKSWAGQ